jgi:uncharacterized protein
MEELIFDTLKRCSFNPLIIESDKVHLVITLTILARPASKLEKISPGPNGEMVVHLKAKPVDGAANIGIVKILSKLFGLPQSNIVFKSGEKSKSKKLILTFNFSDRKNEGFFKEKFISSYGKLK